ncbi:MAG: TrpB-like pyridoxal phosphate-dependent enzyme [candidate division WS1 bacterium]|jgi:tryptophan synthase beta chain|nr:TrpB-like pyridoxal phosphate-dependent enzyme [candidate division WS1 bacterium]
MADSKIFLSESEMPQAWYNIQPDLPAPLMPPLNPATGEPLVPEDLLPLFPMSLIEQEMGMERWVDIPDEVLRIYKLWRPSPLHRAFALEEELGTPARIYYKNESVSPAGSHKPNTAVAQAYYNKQDGVTRIATETGAGQWGSALALACSLFDIECQVYMVRISYDQKPYRRLMMETWGAQCLPSPSNQTEAGRRILARDPDSPGSLGLAISEAVEDAASREDTKYSLGSVLNHVLMHQTITGLEIKKQLAIAGDKLDVLCGCVGGGSNFAGFCFPFVKDKLDGQDIRFVGAEPRACPKLTRAQYRYDFGDNAQLTPLLKMHTLGHSFIPPPIHAGGLRYHGDAPLLSLLVDQKLVEARAYYQNEVFEAAVTFARTEGHLPAPETAHAIKCGIDEALRCKETGKEECIVIGYSGHGHFDLASYDAYLRGQLEDVDLPQETIDEAMKDVPDITWPR